MKLSPRMEAVIGLLASGHRQKEIPDLLKLSASTVATYVTRIRARLAAKSTMEAVSIFANSENLRHSVRFVSNRRRNRRIFLLAEFEKNTAVFARSFG